MATLSVTQAYKKVRRAGFDPATAVVAVAIGIAESGLRTDAIGPVGEFGVMQIYPVAHPQYSRACLFNAQCNMNAAHDIYVGWRNSFRAWTTYISGAYRQNISKVEKAVNQSANLAPDVTGPQSPRYTFPSPDNSSQDNTGPGLVLGLGISALVLFVAVLAIIGMVLWISIKE